MEIYEHFDKFSDNKYLCTLFSAVLNRFKNLASAEDVVCKLVEFCYEFGL